MPFREGMRDFPPVEPQPQTDQEYRTSLGSFEMFTKWSKDRELLSQLSEVTHSMEEVSILEHTYRLLHELNTDPLRTLSVRGITSPIPDFVRTVALYHDVDKAIKSGNRDKKTITAERAMDEIFKHDRLLKTKTDQAFFSLLLKTCDYFGYNLRILDLSGSKQQDAIQEILERKITQPLEDMENRFGDLFSIHEEDLLRIQHAISRADTLAIGPFRSNINKIDRLAQLFLQSL